jgi:hypothetical protein
MVENVEDELVVVIDDVKVDETVVVGKDDEVVEIF